MRNGCRFGSRFGCRFIFRANGKAHTGDDPEHKCQCKEDTENFFHIHKYASFSSNLFVNFQV